MSASEAIRIIADEIGASKNEVIEALVYNVVIESIREQVDFLRTGKIE